LSILNYNFRFLKTKNNHARRRLLAGRSAQASRRASIKAFDPGRCFSTH
jgi:hypothetical protein